MDLIVGEHYILSGGALIQYRGIESFRTKLLHFSLWSGKGYWKDLRIDLEFLSSCSPKLVSPEQAKAMKTLFGNGAQKG